MLTGFILISLNVFTQNSSIISNCNEFEVGSYYAGGSCSCKLTTIDSRFH